MEIVWLYNGATDEFESSITYQGKDYRAVAKPVLPDTDEDEEAEEEEWVVTVYCDSEEWEEWDYVSADEVERFVHDVIGAAAQ